MKTISIAILSLVFVSKLAFAAPAQVAIFGIDGEPEQGQTISLNARPAVMGTIRVFLADDPVYSRATRIVEQTVTSVGGYFGPVNIQANFQGFTDGELIYAIPSEGDPATGVAAYGEPLVFGHPLITGTTFGNTSAYRITLHGSGFTQRAGSAQVVLANSSDWAQATVRVTQNIISWNSQKIEFEVLPGGLSAGSDVFAFVIDDDGDRSVEGFRLRLGKPQILGVSLNGGSLSINGLNFANRGGQDILFDDFELGTNGGAISATPETDWQNWHAGAVYTNTRSYSGSLSAYGHVIPPGHELFATNFYEFEPSERIFLSYVISYIAPDDPATLSGVLKLSRLGTNHPSAHAYSGEGMVAMASPSNVWPTSIGCMQSLDGVQGHLSVPGFPSPDGAWSRIEMFYKVSDPGKTNGTLRWMRDGQTIEDFAALTRYSGNDSLITTSIMGIMGSAITQELHIHIDDYYISSTLARVIVTDSPTYDPSRDFSIQPVVSWSNNQVQAVVKPGRLGSLIGKYLIVIDNQGNQSAGYQIQSGDTLAPQPPSGLRLQ